MRLLLIALLSFPALAEDDWTIKMGIAYPAYQSNAEFGSGPALKIRAEYQIKERLTFEVEKRSYIFEGPPFGEGQDWESSYIDAGITWEF